MHLPTTYRGWIQSTIVLYVLLLAVKVMYITVLYTLLLNVHLCITAWWYDLKSLPKNSFLKISSVNYQKTVESCLSIHPLIGHWVVGAAALPLLHLIWG